MTDKRYTLTLTGDQLYALTSAFDANFGSGIDEGEPTKAELQVHKKLVRLGQKRAEDNRRAKADAAWRPRMSAENKERMMRNVSAGRRAGDDGDDVMSHDEGAAHMLKVKLGLIE